MPDLEVELDKVNTQIEALESTINAEPFMRRKITRYRKVGGDKKPISLVPYQVSLLDLLQKSGGYKGEITYLTKKQFREIMGYEPLASVITPKGIPWEYVFDQLATELGYRSDEDLKKAIERVGRDRKRLEELYGAQDRLTGALEAEAESTKELAQRIRDALWVIDIAHGYGFMDYAHPKYHEWADLLDRITEPGEQITVEEGEHFLSLSSQIVRGEEVARVMEKQAKWEGAKRARAVSKLTAPREPAKKSLADYDRETTLAELMTKAKLKGVSASGSKKTLISRLLHAGVAL